MVKKFRYKIYKIKCELGVCVCFLNNFQGNNANSTSNDSQLLT